MATIRLSQVNGDKHLVATTHYIYSDATLQQLYLFSI